jgi:hypothetical protein
VKQQCGWYDGLSQLAAAWTVAELRACSRQCWAWLWWRWQRVHVNRALMRLCDCSAACAWTHGRHAPVSTDGACVGCQRAGWGPGADVLPFPAGMCNCAATNDVFKHCNSRSGRVSVSCAASTLARSQRLMPLHAATAALGRLPAQQAGGTLRAAPVTAACARAGLLRCGRPNRPSGPPGW